MELAPLLEEAEAASPANRIQWRDRIAAHGSRAIEGVKPWLADPILAAFAVRVIERAGTSGETEHATQVLRSARSRVPTALKGDIDWALHRLRVPSQPTTSASLADRARAGNTPRTLRRQEPYLSTLARPRTRRPAPIRPR